MTSSNGNIFHVIGPLWGESTGHRWIPLTKASDVELWYFLWSVPEQMAVWTFLIWDAIAHSLWHHCDELIGRSGNSFENQAPTDSAYWCLTYKLIRATWLRNRTPWKKVPLMVILLDHLSLHGPLARYEKMRVAHTPGMPGTFSPSLRVSDPDMHHGTCVTHVPWCMSRLLTGGFLWSR